MRKPTAFEVIIDVALAFVHVICRITVITSLGDITQTAPASFAELSSLQ